MESSAMRTVLRRYVSGELSLSEFEDAFLPLSMRAAQLPEDDADAMLAARIELVLAELSQGDRSEEEAVRRALAEELATIVVVVGEPVRFLAASRTAYALPRWPSASKAPQDPRLETRAAGKTDVTLRGSEVSESGADTRLATVSA